MSDTDIADDVSKGVTSMIDDGQALMDKVTSNSINLFERVTTYAPILLTAEDAINGSVRVDDERITAETLGLSRAIGARGQMLMQQLLVNLGAELPEPELRTRMIALAGTEPSTLFGMSQVLGVGSTEAQKLQDEMVRRLAIMSDPLAVLVNNPDLRASEAVTDQIAGQIITDATASVTSHSGGAGVGAARSGDPRRGDRRWRDPAGADRRHPGGAVARSAAARGCGTARCGWPTTTWPEKSSSCVPVTTLGPSNLLRCTPRRRWGRSHTPSTNCTSRLCCWPASRSRLQLQVGDMFETLSRRSRSLVDQQLSLIDRLERNEEDPERLESLFRLDHLAARMRRNGANLLVLAGAQVPREQAEPVPVSAVINAAASEVEDYTRVVTATVPDSEIVGSVAGDLVHLLAELLDNALRYSPPISQVRVSAVHTGNGGLGHRGQRHRARHDRHGPAPGQHASAIRR